MMTPEKLRARADAMEHGLGVTFGDTPMALRTAADEIETLRKIVWAAIVLVDNSPVDDKGRPHISETTFHEFDALVEALR